MQRSLAELQRVRGRTTRERTDGAELSLCSTQGLICCNSFLLLSGSGWWGGYEQRAGRSRSGPFQRSDTCHLEEVGTWHSEVPRQLDDPFPEALWAVQSLGEDTHTHTHTHTHSCSILTSGEYIFMCLVSTRWTRESRQLCGCQDSISQSPTWLLWCKLHAGKTAGLWIFPRCTHRWPSTAVRRKLATDLDKVTRGRWLFTAWSLLSCERWRSLSLQAASCPACTWREQTGTWRRAALCGVNQKLQLLSCRFSESSP